VLPVEQRVRRSDEFARTIRFGRRAGSALLVVHLLTAETPDAGAADDHAAVRTARTGPSRAGFVVSKAVGGAVVRNRVKRRLRHLVAERIGALPAGSTLVVRALAPAAAADLGALAGDLDSALRRSAGGPGSNRTTRQPPRRRP
jgi:ribonuclease P protein component